MGEQLLIRGGEPLEGTISVFGSKNAALPVLAATLLTEEPCVIRNVPRIVDIMHMLALIESLGADVAWTGEREVTVEARDIALEGLRRDLVPKLRGSVLLLGPLLARLGEITVPYPGGDQIGARPIDVHLSAFHALGVVREEGQREGIALRLAPQLDTAREVVLKEFSVTATENALLLASALPFPVTIAIAAVEPHVQDLVAVLNKMGADVRWIDAHTLAVRGARKRSGVTHTLIPDAVEAGTWLIAGLATRGKVTVEDIRREHMLLVLDKLADFGAHLAFPDASCVSVEAQGRLTATGVQVMPYPGIPTDLQSPFGVLGTQAVGTTHIHDPLFEGRFRYITELKKMGAEAIVANTHEAYIVGPAKLFGVEIDSLDIRSGAALIIAGLLAEGSTTINNAAMIDRGYERIDERLRGLGADIRRITP